MTTKGFEIGPLDRQRSRSRQHKHVGRKWGSEWRTDACKYLELNYYLFLDGETIQILIQNLVVTVVLICAKTPHFLTNNPTQVINFELYKEWFEQGQEQINLKDISGGSIQPIFQWQSLVKYSVPRHVCLQNTAQT